MKLDPALSKAPAHIRPFSYFRSFILVVLLTGIVFRCSNLDLKIYAHDEVYTSIRVSGYSGVEVSTAIRDRTLTVQQLLQFQTPDDRTWGNTWEALQVHPEHPPLFYLLERAWMKIFGSSIKTVRSLPVIFSLLAFPAIYWLCLELFESATTGWVAIALLAVSPFHVLFAQEARQYSLWTLLTLISSAALLWGLRTNRYRAWLLYGTSSLLNVYTSLLSPLVVAAQAIYVIILAGSTRTERMDSGEMGHCYLSAAVRNSLLAIGIVTLGFVPWLWVLVSRWQFVQTVTGWLNYDKTLIELIRAWGVNLSKVFIDLPLNADYPANGLVSLVFAILVFVAFAVSICETPLRVWLLPVSTIVITTLPLVLSDLVKEGQRSTITRYFTAALVVVLIVVADFVSRCLTAHLTCRSAHVRKFGQGLFCLLLTCGFISSAAISTSDMWWNKNASPYVAGNARFINQFSQPLVISGTGPTSLGNLISLSHKLAPDAQIHFVVDGIPTLPTSGNLFLIDASEELRTQLLKQQAGMQMNPVFAPEISLRRVEWVE